MTDLSRLTPEAFGVLMARAVKELPYSGNWALVGKALELGGHDLDDLDQIPELIDRISSAPLPVDEQAGRQA